MEFHCSCYSHCSVTRWRNECLQAEEPLRCIVNKFLECMQAIPRGTKSLVGDISGSMCAKSYIMQKI